MQVRRARPSDAASVVQLLVELGYEADEPALGERLRRDESLVWLAVQDAEVIGLLAAYVAPYFPRGVELMRITALVVTAQRRRSGVGKTLVDAARGHARRCGVSALEVTTDERRCAAHGFYEALGFTHTSRRYWQDL